MRNRAITVALSLLGGIFGAAVGVGLTEASWKPFHDNVLGPAREVLERGRADRAAEIEKIEQERDAAVAAVASELRFAKVTANGIADVIVAESRRDAAGAVLAEEKATLAALIVKRNALRDRVKELRLQTITAANRVRPQSKALSVAGQRQGVQGLADELTNSIGMRFKLIPAGEFLMGSAAGESDEQPAHQVVISAPYYIGVYEVTEADWTRVMGDSKGTASRPACDIGWDEVQVFCGKLSALSEEVANGCVYRLPTEAEWEYACRAGTATEYSFGDNELLLGEFAWFGRNSGGQPHPVGQKKPNPWGLYDMHGNVLEWCSDWYGGYTSGVKIDPQGQATGSDRVLRGGSWDFKGSLCGSADRFRRRPSNRSGYDGFGFRLVLSTSSK